MTTLITGATGFIGAAVARRVLAEGRPVRVRFEWSQMHTGAPRWQQAFSDDGGATWEVNWVMEFARPV